MCVRVCVCGVVCDLHVLPVVIRTLDKGCVLCDAVFGIVRIVHWTVLCFSCSSSDPNPLPSFQWVWSNQFTGQEKAN